MGVAASGHREADYTRDPHGELVFPVHRTTVGYLHGIGYLKHRVPHGILGLLGKRIGYRLIDKGPLPLRFNKCRTKRVGGYVITAHPFRSALIKPERKRALIYQSVDDPLPNKPEDAVGHPVFQIADAVEVANGGTVDGENEFAMRVASLIGLPVTGGSDAHSVHGLGKFVTAFRDEINSESEFLAGLHSGTFFPAMGLRLGQLRPYTL